MLITTVTATFTDPAGQQHQVTDTFENHPYVTGGVSNAYDALAAMLAALGWKYSGTVVTSKSV